MPAGTRILVATFIAVFALVGPGAPASHSLAGPIDVEFGDTDHDGLVETSVSGVAGGPCACRCPIVGGSWTVAVLGQVVALTTRSALGVCGTRLAAGLDPGAPDPGGSPPLGSRFQFNPNGLGRGGPAG